MKPAGIRGWFEPERLEVRFGESFSVELLLRNEGERDAFVFVPQGPAGGLEIEVLEGGEHEVSGLEGEPEPGAVGGRRLQPGETYRQEFPLSRWLSLREPVRYLVECRIRVDVAAEGRTEALAEVASRLELDVQPQEVA